jgi:hypothetical protein
MGEMKKWPEIPDPYYSDNCFPFEVQTKLAYERARADCWEERCRVAVEALKAVQLAKPNEYYYVEVDEALSSIGDIPGDK